LPPRRSDEKETGGPAQWNWEKETLRFLGAAVLIVGLAFLPAHEATGTHIALGASLPLWTILPFFALLLCIALLPLTVPGWWEANSNKALISTLLALPVVIYLGVGWREAGLVA